MHDGAFKTLEEVIAFLNRGGGEDSNRSSLMKPLGLTEQEQKDLLAFLHALKGEEIPFDMPKLPE